MRQLVQVRFLLAAPDLFYMANNQEIERQIEQVELEEKNGGKKKKRNNAIKYVAYLLFVLIVTAAAVVITLYQDFNEIMHQLMTCDWKWLVVVLGLMLLVTFIRAFILFCFARLYTRDYHIHRAIAVDQIGQFYNAVTPGASGGQVMQAYTLKKQGIAISSAVSMLAMYSIVYQTVLIIFGLLSFVIKYDAINSIGSIRFQIADWSFSIPIWPLTIIGFLLNVGVIGIVLLMGYWKQFHYFVMGPIIGLLHKIRIIKYPDKTRESLRVQVENFKIEMRRLFANIPFTLLIATCFALYITIKFSIPYFIGLALGNESSCANFWDSVFLNNYHQMVTGLIPIPGSAGVSEYFFARLFVSSGATASNSFYFSSGTAEDILASFQAGSSTMVNYKMEDAINLANSNASSAFASAALLIWRSMTFTIPIILGGFITAFYRASPRNEDAPISADRKTFVSLQSETMVARTEDMEAMLQTSRLKREDIMARLNPSKKKKKRNSAAHINRYDDVTIEHEDDSI